MSCTSCYFAQVITCKELLYKLLQNCNHLTLFAISNKIVNLKKNKPMEQSEPTANPLGRGRSGSFGTAQCIH